MKSKIFRYILSALTIFLLVFLLFNVVLLVSHFFLREAERESSAGGEYTYQYYEYNPRSNRTNMGFATLGQKLDEEEFINYENSEGQLILISNFESNRYLCTGKCYCEGDEFRRLSTSKSIVSRGLKYLLVAASSSVAYNLAKTHFSEQCSTAFEEEEGCPNHLVRSEVEECEDLDDLFTYELDEKLFVYDEDQTMRRNFECQGSCMVRIWTDGKYLYQQHNTDIQVMGPLPPGDAGNVPRQMQKKCEEYGCEKLKMEGVEVSLTVDSSVLAGYDMSDKKYRKALHLQFLKGAMERFISEDLHPLCVIESALPMLESPFADEINLGEVRSKVNKEVEEIKLPRCVGYQTEDMNNPSVRCILKV